LIPPIQDDSSRKQIPSNILTPIFACNILDYSVNLITQTTPLSLEPNPINN
jgi:hypothetical protein